MDEFGLDILKKFLLHKSEVDIVQNNKAGDEHKLAAIIECINFGLNEVILRSENERFSADLRNLTIYNKNKNIVFKGKSRRAYNKVDIVTLEPDYEFTNLRKNERFWVEDEFSVVANNLTEIDYLSSHNAHIHGIIRNFSETGLLVEVHKGFKQNLLNKKDLFEITIQVDIDQLVTLQARLVHSGNYIDGDEQKYIAFELEKPLTQDIFDIFYKKQA